VTGNSYHEAVRNIVMRAGEEILDVYYSSDELEIQSKQDDSPLTIADQRAHRVIVDGLTALDPAIPVLSEEAELVAFAERQHWQKYWLVDPLDGTKEFIGKNGEFTVNIALIEHGHPLAGWVGVPVKSVLYYGWCGADKAAFKEHDGIVTNINTRPLDTERPLDVVASRRHGGESLVLLLEKARKIFPDIELNNFGSSLKICMVAEGAADWYPRLAPTSEWDTAAAHAVLVGAGGSVVNDQFEPLTYNQKESVLNPFFHAFGRTDDLWLKLVKDS